MTKLLRRILLALLRLFPESEPRRPGRIPIGPGPDAGTDPTRWRPDDSFHDIVEGEFKGVLRVKKALKELNVDLGSRVFTSRDRLIPELEERLRRTTLPKGFQQWQLPIVLGGSSNPVMSFVTVGSPGAKIPEHSHANDTLLRVVLNGSIIIRTDDHEDLELFPGDWMYVPTGLTYSFIAGRLGCSVMHLYNGQRIEKQVGVR
jgi:quercetin dioxygenase-like cupin family protein